MDVLHFEEQNDGASSKRYKSSSHRLKISYSVCPLLNKLECLHLANVFSLASNKRARRGAYTIVFHSGR